MKKNMGTIDRIVRVFVAALLAYLFFSGALVGVLGIVALIIAGVFVVTAVFARCPLYCLIGMRTCPVQE